MSVKVDVDVLRLCRIPVDQNPFGEELIVESDLVDLLQYVVNGHVLYLIPEIGTGLRYSDSRLGRCRRGARTR